MIKLIFFIGSLFAASIALGQFSFVYTDGAGTGFLDNTSASPVGGNTGTTIGEQRRNVLIAAAATWEKYLDIQGPVEISASFEALACNSTSGVLAYAGPANLLSDFPAAPVASSWYVAALCNHLSQSDKFPGAPEIGVGVNSAIDDDSSCIGGVGFYYGLDRNPGTQVHLLEILEHELGHGLGFLSLVNLTDGSLFLGQSDTFTNFITDLDLGTWPSLTDAQRLSSITNTGRVVWTGANTSVGVTTLLDTGSAVNITQPNNIEGAILFGSATFGSVIGATIIEADVVLVDDGTAPNADACSEPFVNAADLVGKIALIDRGTCLFVEKVKRAQNAGAIAVIIANNVAGSPIGMSGNDATITIPSALISLEDGNKIKAELPRVRMKLDASGYAGTFGSQLLLYAPNPVEEGSSISHWEVSASPNLLMEPFSDTGLRADPDLTLTAMREIGWKVRDIPFANLTYDLWAQMKITDEGNLNNARTQDADGDGIDNFTEYAFGTLPLDPISTPITPEISLSSSNIDLEYKWTDQATDLEFTLMESTNLQNWIQSTGIISQTSVDFETELDIHTFELPSTATRKFYRIEATEIPTP